MKIKIKLNEVKRVVRLPAPPKEEFETDNNKKEKTPQKHNKEIIASVLGPQIAKNAIEVIPLLSEDKIKKKLAQGTLGTIFIFPDDRLLKIYMGSYIGGVDLEDQRYEKLKSRIFSGQGTKGDLLIYDHGTQTFDSIEKEYDYRLSVYKDKIVPLTFGWVVMGKILPLQDYILIKTNMDREESRDAAKAYDIFYTSLDYYAYDYLRKGSPSYINPKTIQDVKNHDIFQSNVLNASGYASTKMLIDENFPDRFIDEILKIYFDSGNNFKVFRDLHIGNVGVRNEIDPTPVIFDV